MTHHLSTNSYQLLTIVLHESVITLAIYGGILVFRNACITEWPTISFFSTVGFAQICSMAKSICLVGVAQGGLLVILPSWETKRVFYHGITMIPEDCSCIIFAKTAPIKLNGNA